MKNTAYIIAFYAFYFLSGISAHSQNTESDKLLQRVFNKSFGLSRKTLLLDLVDSLEKKNNTKVIYYFSTEAIKKAHEDGDSSVEASAYNSLGNLYNRMSYYTKAIACYQKAIRLVQNSTNMEAIISLYSNLTTSYYHFGDADKMLVNAKKALAFAEKLPPGKDKDEDLCGIYNSLGTCFCLKENYVLGRSYFFKSYQMALKTGDSSMMSYYFNNIAYIFKYQNKLDSSLVYYIESMKLKELSGANYDKINAYTAIGSLYIDKKDYDQALKYINKAYLLCDTNEINEDLTDVYKNFTIIYSNKHDTKNELRFFKLWKAGSDTNAVRNEKSEIVQQELQFEFDKIHLTDSIKSAEQINMRDQKLSQKKKESYYFIIALILAAVAIGFIYNRFQLTKKQKAVIEEQKMLVDIKNKEIIESIRYAKQLQEAILPTATKLKNAVSEHFVLYLPKDIVAGDFYWLHTVSRGVDDSGAVLIAAADCTGHGVPGAMMSIACNNALKRTIEELQVTNTGEVLDSAREMIIENFSTNDISIRDGMDISLLAINEKKKIVEWSGANNRLLYVSNGVLIEIKGDKQPIGNYEKKTPFKTNNIPYNKGDVFYLFTDGFIDQFGGSKNKKFGINSFKTLIEENKSKSLSQQLIAFETAFNSWKKITEQIDDVTVLAIKI